LVRHGSALRNT